MASRLFDFGLGRSSDEPGIRRRNAYIAGVLVSSFGGGLVLPLTGIYIVRILAAPGSVAATAYLLMGFLGLSANPLTVRALARRDPTSVFVLGLCLQGLGFAVVAAAGPVTPLVVGGIGIIGIGNGVVFTVRALALRSLFGEDELTETLAARNVAANLAVGIGAAISAPLIFLWGMDGARLLFIVNCGTYLLLAAITWRLRQPEVVPEGDARRLPSWAQVVHAWRDRRFLPFIIVQLLVGLVALSQFDSVIPVILSDAPTFPFTSLGLPFFANCVGVVLLQSVGTRFIKRRGHMTGVAASLVVWVACFVASAILPAPVISAWWWPIVLGVWFAVGEVLFAPSMQPLAIRAARGEAIPSYAGTAGLTGGVAAMLGPSAAFLVVNSIPGWAYWIALSAGLGLAIVAFAQFSRANPDLRGPQQAA